MCYRGKKRYSQNMRQLMNIKKAWSKLAWRADNVQLDAISGIKWKTARMRRRAFGTVTNLKWLAKFWILSLRNDEAVLNRRQDPSSERCGCRKKQKIKWIDLFARKMRKSPYISRLLPLHQWKKATVAFFHWWRGSSLETYGDLRIFLANKSIH